MMKLTLDMVKIRSIMPILVLIIAVGFHGVDIFTEYTVTESQLVALDVFLAPFGLGGLLKSGYKVYTQAKTSAGTITKEELQKIEDLLNRLKNAKTI